MRNPPVSSAPSPHAASAGGFVMRRLAQALAAASLLTTGLAPLSAAEPTLPAGLSVVSGQAQISTIGARMTVTNSAQAILNWNSFSVGSGAGVYFQQPNAASQVLNRVTGSDPSTILGSLASNGKVWLLNPHGVLFGTGARIDVGSLVASTLALSDNDWAAGRFRLTAALQNDHRGLPAVVNQGEIRSALGGSLALIGGSVGNEGLMLAPGGQVVLAAGRSVELVDGAAANLSVRVSAPAGEARNLGTLEATGGRIDIMAAAVNQSGIVRADTLGSGPGGAVWIRASRDILLAAGSRTTADGGSGGSVRLQADAGRSSVQGTVSARGSQGGGGEATLLGREVGLLDGADVDVSGAAGGGRVIVGGGEQGRDARYPNAQSTYIGPSATIKADASRSGDGGSIVVWSDLATRAYGGLSARGGPQGGDGGSIETSGGWLDAQPSRVDTRASLGRNGTWLLDPYDILISDEVANTLGQGPTFTAGGAGSTIRSATITNALANGNNVVVSTGGANGGSERGDISLVRANINVPVVAFGLPGNLTLLADGSIRMLDSSISSQFGAVGVSLQAAQTGAGGVSLVNSSITSGTGSRFGAIRIGGGAAGTTPAGSAFTGAGGAVTAGVRIENSRLSAGNAALTISGVSTLSNGTGVEVDAASRLQAASLIITGDGAADRGVSISGQLATTGALSLRGRGGELGIGLTNARVTAGGPVDITAASILLSGQTQVSSAAAGDAIVLSGGGGSGMSRFDNSAGRTALVAPAGRWIAYSQDVSGHFLAADTPAGGDDGSVSFDPGELSHDFVRHGARFGDWSGDVGNGFVSAARQVVTLGGIGVDRVYNATVAASLAGAATLTPSIASDTSTLVGGASTVFADKNVGSRKPITVTTAAASQSPLAVVDRFGKPVFGYDLVSNVVASITPAPLAVTGLTATSKVYDATASAPLAGNPTIGPFAGDLVGLAGTATGRFANPNAGTGKPVSVSGLALTGRDATNYSLILPQALRANIEPATLVYVAEPTAVKIGTPVGNLPGAVTGLVGGETLAVATTGALVFNVPPQATTQAGRYPVLGAGLVASNYRFEQAPGNALALIVFDPFAISETALPRSTLGLSTLLGKVLPFGTADDALAGLANLVGRPGLDPRVAAVGNFGVLRFSDFSDEQLYTLLSGRDRFKKQLLADARARLAADPALANLGECASLEEAQRGRCLINEELKARAARQQTTLAAAPQNLPAQAAGVAPGLPAAPAPPGSTAAAASPAPAAAAAAPAAAPPVVATAPLVPRQPAVPDIDPLQAQLDLLLANYRVQSAALPQIERKIALVVGVDRYADPAIPTLVNAVRDARSVARSFETRLGYETIVLENATRASVVGALNRLALTMDPRDSVIVYYAGHGELIEATGLGYWLLTDSSSKDPTTWLSNADINRLVGRINSRQVALLSDSCYSGSLTSEDRIRAAPRAPDPQAVLARKSVVVMTSGGNEPVFDEGRDGHSPFAWNLMQTLNKVDDWQAGGNVFERVRFAVARSLPQRPQYSAARSGGHQPGGDYLFEQRRLAETK